MTIEELRSTFEYQLLTKRQRGYVEHFILSRDSVASARIAYNPRKQSTLYTISKQNRRNIRIQACIARYDASSKNGVLRLLKEAVLGKRKLSRRERISSQPSVAATVQCTLPTAGVCTASDRSAQLLRGLKRKPPFASGYGGEGLTRFPNYREDRANASTL